MKPKLWTLSSMWIIPLLDLKIESIVKINAKCLDISGDMLHISCVI